MPCEWCLAGGTALVLYFGHRQSTDLDWCFPIGGVTEAVLSNLSSFESYGDLLKVNGGAGLVDCVLQPKTSKDRAIRMTFFEPLRGFVPKPQHLAIRSSNTAKTPVMHPIDLAACKIQAVIGRGELRDYEDLSTLAKNRPEILKAGLLQLQDVESVDQFRSLRAMVNPSEMITLPERVAAPLREFVSTYDTS